jgi:O-antigen ligase
MNGAESPGNSPRIPRPHGGTGLLPILVLVHFGVFIVFTSWAFGGQAPWVRQVIAGWGAVGVVLFAVACGSRTEPRGENLRRAWRWLWPLLLYDLIVVGACFNPSFKEVMIAGESSLVLGDPVTWLPSSARPVLARHELWQFNVIVLSGFNLVLALPSRRLVRAALFILAGNAVALAVFGTFQKLARADGLWFGLVPSPNPRFFSTFIYHNHWGAFTLLNTAVCLGLLYHYARRGGQRDIWHSPVLLGVLATLLLAATIPLSASRSSTVLMAGLLMGAFIHFLTRLIRHRRQRRESVAAPVAGIILAALVAATAIAYLGREVIAQRLQLTSEQLAAIAKEDTLNSRLTLYRDTWRMAAEKPWFGWGLESYAHVFRIFNTQRAVESWVWIPFYRDAHNDWLQSLAESGFIGTGLRGLLLLLPFFSVGRRTGSGLPRYLLAGNAIILLYAWLEFPFANPAVMLTFCATFYCAMRYAMLELPAQRGESR